MISSLGDGAPVASHHHRLHRFAPLLVGDADDGDVGDVGVRLSDVLDLGRVDVLATRHDHVLDPVVQEQVPVGVAEAGVAGAEPAVVVDRGPRSPSSLAQ